MNEKCESYIITPTKHIKIAKICTTTNGKAFLEITKKQRGGKKIRDVIFIEDLLYQISSAKIAL